MTKTQALDTIDCGLREILKESFDWCKDEDMQTSAMAARINKKAHEIHILLERVRNGQLEE